jgi:hypothetical protein
MIDPLAPTLDDLAATRRIARFRVTPPDGRPYEVSALVLFREPPPRPDAPPSAIPRRADGWRAIVVDGDAEWRPATLFAAEVEPLELVGEAVPPVNLREPHSARRDQRGLAEVLAIGTAHETRCEFRYHRKDAKPGDYETREGALLGVKGDLVFTRDPSRGNAIRSFKIDGIASLFVPVEHPAPRWNGRAYQVTP